MVFEDTHPAIIDPETWEIVRKMREHKRRAPRYGESGIFSGAAYCFDCGNKLYFHTRIVWNKAKTQSTQGLRVRITVPYTVRAYNIKRAGLVPVILSARLFWKKLCLKNCGSFYGSCRGMKSGLSGL